MKTISYWLMLPIACNGLMTVSMHGERSQHTIDVYIEQVTVTNGAPTRSTKVIIDHIGKLCETLLDKPDLYPPQLLLAIFANLIAEYTIIAPTQDHGELRAFQKSLHALQNDVAAQKLTAKAVLERLMTQWPKTATILPVHVANKLELLKKNAGDQAKLLYKLHTALKKTITAYAHGSVDAVKMALAIT